MARKHTIKNYTHKLVTMSDLTQSNDRVITKIDLLIKKKAAEAALYRRMIDRLEKLENTVYE